MSPKQGIGWSETVSQGMTQEMDIEMNALGFEACKSDAGVYVRRKEREEPMYVLVYVDAILIICMV